jgi:nucleotide-binding universal stress UspA family protein
MSGLTVKKILVPTDFSEGSTAAMQYAIGLARICSARLVLLHVMELAVYAVDFAMTHPGVPADIRRKLDDMMEDCVRRVKAEGIEAEGVLATGTPYFEIGKAVERHAIDLIVMGTHGRMGMARVLMGSTAERVVRLAPCPVLTVKAEVKSAPPVEARAATAQAPGPSTFCHLCGRPSVDVLCEACKTKVQAEAVERKWRVEKEGRVGAGRR